MYKTKITVNQLYEASYDKKEYKSNLFPSKNPRYCYRGSLRYLQSNFTNRMVKYCVILINYHVVRSLCEPILTCMNKKMQEIISNLCIIIQRMASVFLFLEIMAGMPVQHFHNLLDLQYFI